MRRPGAFLAAALAGWMTACDRPGDGSALNEAAFIEIAAFSAARGTTEAVLADAFEEVQREFMDGRKGLLRRELAKKSAREFVEILHWRTRADADAAYAEFYRSPVCLRYVALLRPPDETAPGVQRLEVIRSFGR